ncbi:hypothetical protein AGOR_G00191300 [Albula goreensis]|uniref:Uncharacterized protein n=1 Tax=Albula goreensis TaxID=1534307 RepID=A0A8T3CW55_9TELE|nr:hypothetical protein AGOR_G00191300 [Albula goreensis]
MQKEMEIQGLHVRLAIEISRTLPDKMKTVLLFSSLLCVSLAFPVGDSESNEELMQMYRLYSTLQHQQSNPAEAQPAAPGVNQAAAQPQLPAQGIFFPGMAGMLKGEESEEEVVPQDGVGTMPAQSPNSEEAEAAEAEGAEAEGAEAGGPEAGVAEAEPALPGTQGPETVAMGIPTDVAPPAATVDTVVMDTAVNPSPDAAEVIAVAVVAVAELPADPAPADLSLSVDSPDLSVKDNMAVTPLTDAEAAPPQPIQ